MATFTSQPAEAASTDCYIDEANPTTATNNATLIVQASEDSGDRLRALLAFDLTSIAGATVNGDWTLTLNSEGAVDDNAGEIGVYPVTVAFTEAATWNTRNGSNNWTAPGGDLGTVLDTVTFTSVVSAGSDAVFTIPQATVQAAVGSVLYLALKGVDESGDTGLVYSFATLSSSGDIVAERPVLTGDYTAAASATRVSRRKRLFRRKVRRAA